jgi:hypothetical protein
MEINSEVVLLCVLNINKRDPFPSRALAMLISSLVVLAALSILRPPPARAIDMRSDTV